MRLQIHTFACMLGNLEYVLVFNPTNTLPVNSFNSLDESNRDTLQQTCHSNAISQILYR